MNDIDKFLSVVAIGRFMRIEHDCPQGYERVDDETHVFAETDETYLRRAEGVLDGFLLTVRRRLRTMQSERQGVDG
ncbi:hypothetical protein WI36_24150 [Burkholderia ubonensis]|uniref:hypothetical protein n=1 Tax=Burkholderia ubonensis TaxID=101571 RepID=UPI00075DC251|nr:hypothetical protein [Burkholderia ubonensis]KUZ66862.1 hypothetical protein WI36_24150 [Burkholderia ubonensis]